MAGRKKKCGNLSVFKGRTRRLTKAIFWILAQNPPLVIWDICIAVRKRKGLRYTKYSVVNHRIRTLEKRGYLEKSGTRKTHKDSESPLYQLTPKAYLAIVLDKINLDIFWLKDKSLEEMENLPEPDVIATEIMENLEFALEQFRGIHEDLET